MCNNTPSFSMQLIKVPGVERDNGAKNTFEKNWLKKVLKFEDINYRFKV